MKRKLIITAVLLVILAGFGALLHSPPSIVDAFTGATPKVKRTEQAKVQLEGNYVFCINYSMNGMDSDSLRDELKRVFSGESDHLSVASITPITVYLSETDYALVRYAKTLCNRFAKTGVSVIFKKYSDTMLRSRVLSGRYEVFLASEDLLDLTALENADYIVVSSSEMR
ncbi:MAG: hypothetical protein IJ860_02590 [Eubacterium sp.]|nr:hypothetical protein [Eubacterium sp.]